MLLDNEKNKRERRLVLPLRVPESLLDYVRTRAGWTKNKGKWTSGGHGAMTRVTEDLVRLHMHLHRRLLEFKIRLQRYALDEGLDWQTQEHEVYARLVIRGLEDAERK